MTSVSFLAQEKIWFDKPRYDEAERRFYERRGGGPRPAQDAGSASILQDIARARENIQKSLAGLKTTLCGSAPPLRPPAPNSSPACSPADQELVSRIKNLELENQNLHKVMDDLRRSLSKLESRVAVLEAPPAATALTNGTSAQKKANTPSKTEDDDSDDLDLFGSDDSDQEAETLREQRVKEYAAKRSAKPPPAAKSSILLDVKPWDDETDMRRLEASVRSVQMDGLLWGSSKLVPVGYGIHKLQIGCVVEDDKVGTDALEEELLKFHLYVQSVDVAAFNKI
ncbi:eukaryotic translation elongation factor 1 delta b (guanine nucleotide exchange protein) [Neosynchiropus ocellatus]